MKKIVLLFSIVFLAFAPVFSTPDMMAKAENLYRSGNFDSAAVMYQSLIASGIQSSGLYYNMGNACFKSDRLALAILNYERALRLDPHDEDIRFNLELSRTYVVDKIKVINEFFLMRWLTAFYRRATPDGWAVISIISLFIFFLSLSVYLFFAHTLLRKVAFAVGLVFIMVVIVTIWSAYKSDQLINRNDEAIVMSNSLTVKSSPDQSGTELFVIHEGTKVTINDRLGTWVEVRLSDGKKGWVQQNNLEII